MENYFLIPARLPSLNEYINACRRNKYAGAKLKRETETLIGYFIASYKARGKLQAVSGQVDIEITFTEPNRKRDVDNVQSGQKYILDALKNAKIIKDDSPKYIRQITHKVEYAKEPSVLVVLKEIDND